MTTTTRPHDHTHNDHTHDWRIRHAHVLGARAGVKRAEVDMYALDTYEKAETWIRAWESMRLREVWRMPDPYEGVGTEVRLLLNMLGVQVRDTYENAYMRGYVERMTQYAMWESAL